MSIRAHGELAPDSDSQYTVCTHDQPVGGTPVDRAALERTLEQLPAFHSLARQTLAQTAIPREIAVAPEALQSPEAAE